MFLETGEEKFVNAFFLVFLFMNNLIFQYYPNLDFERGSVLSFFLSVVIFKIVIWLCLMFILEKNYFPVNNSLEICDSSDFGWEEDCYMQNIV